MIRISDYKQIAFDILEFINSEQFYCLEGNKSVLPQIRGFEYAIGYVTNERK